MLYLFVVVELYKTVVAYVETRSVVIAVIDAGFIAVVYVLLLVGLLVGFRVIHREAEDSELE